ncbi:MAG: glycoside hydrolase family 127 protein, partial [Bacteroidota bacterium]|nr:glycoside hydrolase family 127 protein [Bacteroidota bacterium]
TYGVENGYAIINRNWNPGDKLAVHFPMDVMKVAAADSVKADQNRFALQRGPLVYCLEGPDNKDSAVMNIVVDKAAPVKEQFQPALLNGVMTLGMKGNATKRQLNSDELIRTEQTVTAIPYYAWANRGPSEMEVWIPSEASAARPKPAPSIASRSKVSGSVNSVRMLRALNDQYEPQDSKDGSASYLHWWPKKNTTEWVQYDFDRPQEVSYSSVYWFDDGPWGGCRVPASWILLYKKGDEWVPVENASGYGTKKDKYNEVQFDPVVTTALRLEVKLPADNASGIHEWIVK